MSLDRRTFLQSLGAGALAVLAGGATAAEAPLPDSPLPTFERVGEAAYWQAVRSKFPLRDDPVYLNTGGLGPAAQSVLDVVDHTMRQLQEHSETGHEHFESARQAMARFLGAQAAEICFVRNATEGNSIVAAGLALRAGDEVIFETHAHPGGSFPWLNQAQQRGVNVRLFEPDHASAEGNLDRIRKLVTPRTRVVQVSHITCTTGLVMPVPAIAEFARGNGLWFHVDGAQSAGMVPLNLPALGCDSYAFSGHKWLGGPHETGVLCLRRDRLDRVAPTCIGAYSGDLAQLPGEIRYVEAATRHEYGTRSAGLVLGLTEAVRLQGEIGRERIAAYGRALANELHDEFSHLADLEVLTPRPPELRASITTIRHPRADATRLFGYLMEKHRLRCRPVTEQNLGAVRISTHVFNSAAENRRIIAAVRASLREL